MTPPPDPPPDPPDRPDPPGGPALPGQPGLLGGPDPTQRSDQDGAPVDAQVPAGPQPVRPFNTHPPDGQVDVPMLPGPQPVRPFRTHQPGGQIDVRVSAIPPEARAFQGARAGLVSRLVANTVDFGVVAAILGAGYLGVAALRFLWNSRAFSFPTAPFGLFLLLGGGVTVVYLTGSWMTTGRTYGDHLLGLRVISPWGRPLRIGGALIRAVLSVLFPIGLFWVAVSRENRSLQDVLLRTSVIYDWGVVGRG